MVASLKPTSSRGRIGLGLLAVLAVALALVGDDAGAGGETDGLLPLPATAEDFFQRATQPATEGFVDLVSSSQCQVCHGNYDPEFEPYAPWAASMLGQSARDPVFWAGVDVANQDVDFGGQLCIRCHAPSAFLGDRLDPPDGSPFEVEDFEGITCNVCHRIVDPIYDEGEDPVEDAAILETLAAEGLLPVQGSNAQYIVDPADNRRGPFDDLPFNPHFGNPQPLVLVSPHHTRSEFCWTCHDVNNPLLVRQKDGSYVLDTLDMRHPTADQTDMFPLHRTYGEWNNSYYNTLGGVQHNGRFGGNHATGIMNTCQDCHMPDQQGRGCNLGNPFAERPDVPQHSFIGSNTWVLSAVRDLFPDRETGLSAQTVDAAQARNVDMLERASDLELTQEQGGLVTRVINQGGHKLPTGFPDGRRVWINVKFLDGDGKVIHELGAYDFQTAQLTADTTVFESTLGLDAAQSAATGLPEGQTFHFVLANVVLKDNRIPPRGFSNTVAEQNQTVPVGETYLNGQHWHDTEYVIPTAAMHTIVTVYYQVTTREFIEFLRDNGNTRGQTAYDLWVAHGMSQPVVMDMMVRDLLPSGDINGDGFIDFEDILVVLAFYGNCPDPPEACPVDLNRDGVVDFGDILVILGNWGAVPGACCLNDGSCDFGADETDCVALGGTYQGNGTICQEVACEFVATGACCFEDGSCVVLTETDCTDQGGGYAGDDVTCQDANCP